MTLRVGIIGAGIAGLTLATRLKEAGHQAVVLDKGRGVGGRTSTRRSEGVAFDHGAQYFTIRDPRFREFLEQFHIASSWKRWEGRFATLKAGQLSPETGQEPRFVGVPGMNSVARAIASKLDVQTDCKVVEIVGSPGRWTLINANDRQFGPFDWVVSTAPPAQSAVLIEGRSTISTEIAQVRMRPCFALMIVPSGVSSLSCDGIRAEHPVLGWLANDHSKPGRGTQPALVIQSNHDWAEAHVDDPLPAVAQSLKHSASEALKINLEASIFESTHRWLYAKPVEPLGKEFAIDLDARLAACGDWCLAAKVEGAFLSGFQMAERLKLEAV